MGTRYRKSIKVAPGVKVNVGKKSVGISVGNEFSGISVNSKTGAHARVSAPGTGMSYTTKIKGASEFTDIPLSADSEPMPSDFEISQISRRTTTASQEEKPKNDKLNSVLNKMLIVTFSLPTNLLNDPEFSKETYCADIQNTITDTRNQWELLIDDPYVPVIFYDAQSNQIAIADSTGKIQVK